MSLIFNGTEVQNIIYNGTELDSLIYNGIVVFSKQVAPITILSNGVVQEGCEYSMSYVKYNGSGSVACTVQEDVGYIGLRIQGNGDEDTNCEASLVFTTPIDVTNYTKAKFIIYQRSGAISYSYCGLITDIPDNTHDTIWGAHGSNPLAWSYYTSIPAVSTGSNVEYEIDLTDITGEYYLGIVARSSLSSTYGYLRLSGLMLE